MTEIHVKVSGASAVARRTGPLVAGTVGMPVHFSFSSAWDGLNVIAVFEGAKTLSAALLGQTETTVPWEVLAESGGQLRIGAEGRKSDGSIVIPTVWANVGYIEEGVKATDEEASPPTPGLYDQIMKAIEDGKLKGDKGDKGDTGPAVEVADDLETKASDIALSANMGVVLREKIENDLLELDKETQAQLAKRVQTVNGVAPDESGNVVVEQVSEERIVDLETAVQGIIDEMNYKNIDITAFSCPGAGTYEMGRSVAAPTITWSLNKTPASQSLNGEALGVDVRSKAYSGNITSNKTYTLNVTGQKGEKDSASGSFTFYNGVYYGVMEDGAAINNAAVLGLTRKLQGSRGITFTANAGAAQRIAFAIPSRYGTPTFKDAETGFQAGFYKASTFAFTNASEYTENYDVWLSTNAGLGSLTATVS